MIDRNDRPPPLFAQPPHKPPAPPCACGNDDDDDNPFNMTDDEFDAAYPQVFQMCLDAAKRLRASGRKRFGIGAIYEDIRWFYGKLPEQDRREFKLSNFHRAYIARRIIRVEPTFKGFFVLRKSGFDGMNGQG